MTCPIFDVFKTLDEFDLMMFEQPFPGPCSASLPSCSRKVRTPVCLDESLETPEDLREAITLGSLKIANIKIQRVGGFTKALEIYEICTRERHPGVGWDDAGTRNRPGAGYALWRR